MHDFAHRESVLQENDYRLLFAERLQDMRKRRRISRRIMSELCGLSPSMISKYERGELSPKLETLIHLADFFECSIDYLVGRVN